jgi:hypothetical protein
MNRQPRPLQNACLALLALAVFGALPEALHAAGTGFKNQLPIPIIIQGESIVNGALRRGPVLLIHPGKTVWDTNVPPGKRRVIVYEANQPNRTLHQEFLLVENADQAFRVVPLPTPAGGPPRLKLMPLPLP